MRYLICLVLLLAASPVFAGSRHRVVHVQRPGVTYHREVHVCRNGKCGGSLSVHVEKYKGPVPKPEAESPSPTPIAPPPAPPK